MEYMTPHTPQLNGFIERRSANIKEGELKSMLNEKLNDIDHKMMWQRLLMRVNA